MGTLVIIIHPLLTRPSQINGARDSNMREFLEKKVIIGNFGEEEGDWHSRN